ncbi:MAG: hypothetical protein KGD59_02440 [Candidatus Heimdallarchaeota archaeon]|nr:hypothetical protein [Candidatus Heimdallarchaeota archaeon]MBY8993380.1 hypothetical protein [Candidatus Heimdallarchaeota archaeon]
MNKNELLENIKDFFKKKYVFRSVTEERILISGFEEVSFENNVSMVNFYKDVYKDGIVLSVSDFSSMFPQLIKDSDDIVRYHTTLLLTYLEKEIEKHYSLLQEIMQYEKSKVVQANIVYSFNKIERKSKEETIKYFIEALEIEEDLQRKIELASNLLFLDPEEPNPFALNVFDELIQNEELEPWQTKFIQMLTLTVSAITVIKPLAAIGGAVKDFLTNLLSGRVSQFNKEQIRLVHLAVKNTQELKDYFYDYPISDETARVLKRKYDSMLKIECSDIQDEKALAQCRIKKGKSLEDFCKSFFSEANGIIFLDRNRNFENEEIDIIFENNSREPFFMNLQSPLIFVECKNWSTKVGKDEGIVFADKIRQRRGTTKLGIFVALNDCEKGFYKKIAEIQREGFVIAIVTKNHFDDFFSNPPESILSFLKKRILESMK